MTSQANANKPASIAAYNAIDKFAVAQGNPKPAADTESLAIFEEMTAILDGLGISFDQYDAVMKIYAKGGGTLEEAATKSKRTIANN